MGECDCAMAAMGSRLCVVGLATKSSWEGSKLSSTFGSRLESKVVSKAGKALLVLVLVVLVVVPLVSWRPCACRKVWFDTLFARVCGCDWSEKPGW